MNEEKGEIIEETVTLSEDAMPKKSWQKEVLDWTFSIIIAIVSIAKGG